MATCSGQEKTNKQPVGAYFYKFYETTKSENGRSCSEWKSHEEEVLKKRISLLRADRSFFVYLHEVLYSR